ncbi:MAG TPA: hypothetical protein VHG31_00195, partial [Stellaceae bacterium]|nr:hypothetical protein [Stellaceae bacterium]
EKPEVVGLNKIDSIDPAEVDEKCRALGKAVRSGTPILPLSGVSGAGLLDLTGTVFETIREARSQTERGELVKAE